MSMKQTYKNLMQLLLDGPEWFYVPSLERTDKPYRSPTIALAAWAVGWAYRWLTVSGRIFLPAFMLIVLYGTVSLDSPSRILIMVIFVFLAFDFIAGYFFRPKLKLNRKLPNRVRAGSICKVEYDAVNLRKMPIWDMRLDTFTLKPGLKWIVNGTAGCIPFNAKVETIGTIAAERRGKYVLYSPIAETAFPLGIFKRSFRKKNAQDTLLVYPAYFTLNNFILPVGMKYQREGISRVSKVGESMDFFGCREFRHGDDTRHIYWPGSARTGELVIKEYQEEYLTRIALIVDTYQPKLKSFRFSGKKKYSAELEAGLSLAASLTDFLTKGEYVVDIFATGTKIYHFQAGRHLSCLDGILDILACLELNNEHPIHRLSPSVLEEISGIGSAVLILLGWDKEREELVYKMREAGVALRIIIIGKLLQEFPQDAVSVTVDDIVSGRVRNL